MMTIEDLQEIWNAHLPFALDADQASFWLALHTDETVKRGMRITFEKWGRDKDDMDLGSLLRYASKTMNNIKARTRIAAELNDSKKESQ